MPEVTRLSSNRSSTSRARRSVSSPIERRYRFVVGRIVDDAVLERLGHRPDARERAAQVVGDPGHELAPRPFQGQLAVVGLLELVGHGHEVVAEAVEFRDLGSFRHRVLAARELLAQPGERGDVAVDAASQSPGHGKARRRWRWPR